MHYLSKIVAAMGLLLALGGSAQADDIRIQGGGSSFVNPMMQRWVTEYQKQHPEVKIDYKSIGSGGGIKSITDKTFDFGASDAPLSKKEKEKMGGAEKVSEFPVIAGAIVMAYNLPDVHAELKLDGPTIADIYLGTIKNWSDPKIAALNAGVALPNLPITAAHRTDGSGTTYVFTSYLTTQSEEFKNKVGGAKSVEWPPGGSVMGGPQNAGVTAIVQATKGAIGYIELAYAIENKIPFASIKNKDGVFVKASVEAVSLAGEGALGTMSPGHLAANIWNQPGPHSYPISAFTYVIVYKDLGYLNDPKKAQTLTDFFHWVATDGEKLAPPLNYAPLSDGVQKQVQAELKTLTLGGKPVVQ
jgi:phosphate transport system substrate-binding protein